MRSQRQRMHPTRVRPVHGGAQRWPPARPAEGYDDEVSVALDDNHYNNSLTFRCTVCYITKTKGVAAPHFRHQNNSYTYALTHMHNYHN